MVSPVIALVVAMLVGFVLCLCLRRTAQHVGAADRTPPRVVAARGQHAEPSAVVETPAQHAEPSAVVETPTARSLPSPSTTAPSRFAKPRWTATVRRSEGLAVAPATVCVIEATAEASDTDAHVRALELRCGIQTLYTSTLSGFRSDIHDDLRERLTRRDDESTFTLRYSDEARNGNQIATVTLDSIKGIAVVERRISPEWRVELTMPAESQPTAPLSGSGQRLRSAYFVKSASGSTRVSAGASCLLRAMPTGHGDECVAEVRCGDVVLFPTDAAARCLYEGAKPVRVRRDGEPPTIEVDRTTLTVETTARAVISLELQ
jgi:hypothetical protein